MSKYLTPAVRKRIYEVVGMVAAAAAAFKLIGDQDVTAWQESIGAFLALLARLNVSDD